MHKQLFCLLSVIKIARLEGSSIYIGGLKMQSNCRKLRKTVFVLLLNKKQKEDASFFGPLRIKSHRISISLQYNNRLIPPCTNIVSRVFYSRLLLCSWQYACMHIETSTAMLTPSTSVFTDGNCPVHREIIVKNMSTHECLLGRLCKWFLPHTISLSGNGMHYETLNFLPYICVTNQDDTPT